MRADRFLLLPGLIFVFSMTIQAEESKTLEVRFDDLPKLVETRNARVRAARLESDADANREGYLARSFLPRVELGGAVESFRQGGRSTLTQPNYGAELSVSVFNGFRDQIESDRRTFQTRESRSIARITLTEELKRTRSAFWHVIHTKLKIDLLKKAIETNETNQKAAERRIKSGVATESDRLEFEIRSVNLNRDLESAKLELAQYRRELALGIGEGIETQVEPQSSLAHQHEWKSELSHSEAEHEFQIQNLMSRRDRYQLLAKLESSRFLPLLEAYAGYMQFNERGSDRTIEDERHESYVGLRLRFHLGDFWDSLRQAESASIQATALQSDIDFRRMEIESHILTEMNELSFLHNQVHTAEENVKRAVRYYELTKNEYSRGVKNSPDVVGASDRLLDNQLLELALLRDFQISRSHVLSKLGR